VEAAFTSRMAELGHGSEGPLPSPAEDGESPAEATVPPGRGQLMAALRASAALDAAEAPLSADRRRRKPRSRQHTHPSPLSLPRLLGRLRRRNLTHRR
jgi:hypothetical protein